MQIHYYLLHDCELKTNGPAAFVRAMTTFALARDLERDVVAFPQDDANALGAALRSGEGGGALQVRLPQAARRSSDPATGSLDFETFQKRVTKIVEKGAICATCPACATTPARFGCWGNLTVPCSPSAGGWLLKSWLQGVEKANKSRLTRWLTAAEDVEAAGDDDPMDMNTEPAPKEIMWSKGDQRAVMNIDRLVNALAQRNRLEFIEISEILADFGAVDWVQLKGLFRSLKAYVNKKPGRSHVHPDPELGPVPFLHQPNATDPPGVLEWKAFLFACYWAMNLGVEIHLSAVAG